MASDIFRHSSAAPWRPSYTSPPYDPYRYHETYIRCPLDIRRSPASVLWSLTATYVVALTAYGQLLYSLQGERSVLKILYKLLVFIIFPIYPVTSLLVELFFAIFTWRRRWEQDHVLFLSQICGLRAVYSDGQSEPLKFQHLWQGALVTRHRKAIIRIGQAFGLVFISIECLGSLIRTSSRMYINGRGANMDAFLAGDFESFWLSIGTIGVLFKSWLAFFVNVEWRSDDESALRPLDIRSAGKRRMSLFKDIGSSMTLTEVVTEVFFELQTRILTLAILCLTISITISVIVENGLFMLFTWIFIAVPALAWLRRAEADAIPSGRQVFTSGFCATLFFMIPRILFYRAQVRHSVTDRVEWYWAPVLLPWPLMLSGISLILRLLFLRRFQIPYTSKIWRTSHLGVITFGVALLVVIPAYLFSWASFLSVSEYWNCPQLYQDPFWTPSF